MKAILNRALRFLFSVKGLLCTFLSYIIVSRAIGPITSPSNEVIWISYALTVALYLLYKPSVDKRSVILLMSFGLSILLASPLPLFQSWSRYALFVLVFLFVGPLLNHPKINRIKVNILYATLAFCTIISIASFIAFFLGINYQNYLELQEYMDYEEAYGAFSGFATHSMILGPISGYACVGLFYLAYVKKYKVAWLLWFLCLSTLMFSASRIAFIAVIFATVFQILSHDESHSVRNIFLFIIGFALIFTNADFLTRRLEGKQREREMAGLGILDSRTNKWIARIEEFKSSPIYGVGFAAVDPDGKDYYNRKNGQIEPGNSWLAVLSMTGIIGMIPFVLLLYETYKRVKSHSSSDKTLYIGLFTFVLIHMIAEGYILSAGSLLCVISWLIISCAYSVKLQ